MNVLKRAMELSHEFVENVLNDGDIAVDCTTGNGNDTYFMANLVKENGKVYSFDIQEVAIEHTRINLFVSKLDQMYFAVQKIEFMNFVNCPPILIIIERIG